MFWGFESKGIETIKFPEIGTGHVHLFWVFLQKEELNWGAFKIIEVFGRNLERQKIKYFLNKVSNIFTYLGYMLVGILPEFLENF